MNSSFSLVASENVLSPIAKLACSSDFQSRYFFDRTRLWGNWSFYGGKIAGSIQNKILVPSLQKLTKAEYINVKPISGLNCMLVTLASYTKMGDNVLSVPKEMGGHASTEEVARKLGLKLKFLPYLNPIDLNISKLAVALKTRKYKLIYIDQAHCTFPINILHLSKCIKENSSRTFLHVDTSHLNGLILGGVLPNPLDLGADSFGGSTHKTLPGPHKGFFATSNKQIAESFAEVASNLISHHHTGSMVALAITLLEFIHCGGDKYARQIVNNARVFAETLAEEGFEVFGKNMNFTKTHQVWIDPTKFEMAENVSQRLYDGGILISCFKKLPGMLHTGLRAGLNEFTRYGAKEEETKLFAKLFSNIVKKIKVRSSIEGVIEMRKRLSKICYCFDQNLLPKYITKINSKEGLL